MTSTSVDMQYLTQRKTPAISVLLSFIVSGAGQIYNGEVGKGIGMIVAYVICVATSALGFPVVILIGLWIWGMVDANTKAKEFNDVLKKRLDDEAASLQAAERQQAAIKAQTITSQEFVGQVDKYFRLFQTSLLSEVELEAKKKEMIMALTAKKLAEAPEDFLTAIIPLIQKNALTEQDITKIKAAVL